MDTIANLMFHDFVRKYQSCSQYQDIGNVRGWRLPGERPSEPKVQFTTSFQSHNHFQFEWKRGSNSGMVRSDGPKGLLSLGSFAQEMGSSDLYLSLATAAGIAGVAAIIVPCLLFESVRNMMNAWFEMISEISCPGDDEVDGMICHRLVGTKLSPEDTTIWLSKDELLLKKYQSISTTNFDPKAKEPDEIHLNISPQSTLILKEPQLVTYNLVTEITYESVNLHV